MCSSSLTVELDGEKLQTKEIAPPLSLLFIDLLILFTSFYMFVCSFVPLCVVFFFVSSLYFFSSFSLLYLVLPSFLFLPPSQLPSVSNIFVYSNYKLRAGFRTPEQMLHQSRSEYNVFAATCKHYLTGETHLFFVSSELTHFFLIFYSFPSSKVQTMTVSHVQVTIVSQKHSEVSCFPFLRT